MTAPKHWPIRLKLTFMAMGTTAVALLLTIVGIAVFEFVTLRHALHEEQLMLGKIIGDNSTAAVTFNRADDASSILATLGANPNIRTACIYDGTGKILATYVARGETAASIEPYPNAREYTAGANNMESLCPIMLDGKDIGTVYLRSDFRDLRARLTLYAWISPIIFIAASCVGLLIIRRLQRSVSIPIVALADTSRRISKEKNYTLRAPNFGNDELGQLADAFNHMLDGIRQRDEQIHSHLQEVQSARDLLETRVEERTSDLQCANNDLQGEMERRREAESVREQMQANLIEASRKAGMADVATGVLHNVGNVLNSVNVSTQVVHDALKTSRLNNLCKALTLLQENSGDLPGFFVNDNRGKVLPSLLFRLADALVNEQALLLKEIDGLTGNIAHIREIVAMQQNFSRALGVQTPVKLGELIEDAIKINHAGLDRHRVIIRREFDPDIEVFVDRHKVLQILINLISNAKYAVKNNSDIERCIVLRAAIHDMCVRIQVIDNGVGIDADQMTRIFGFGFTTKKDGHGFGLHSSALAAKEIRGALEARSEGLRRGSTFTLTIPVIKEKIHAC